MSSRVPAAPIPADSRRGKVFLAHKRVDERRLPDPRRTEHGCCAIRPKMGADLVQSQPGDTAHEVDGSPRSSLFDRGETLARVLEQIRFCEEHDGGRSTGPSGGQIAFDPPQVEVVHEGTYEERDVDIGGKYLFLSLEPCHLARELGPAR